MMNFPTIKVKINLFNAVDCKELDDQRRLRIWS